MKPSPYAPPQALVIDPITSSKEAEAVRREHLSLERQLKSVGVLYYSGAMLSFSLILLSLMQSPIRNIEEIVIAVFAFALGLVSLLLGYGFRRLKSWVTVPSTVLSSLGLLAFPVGTLINARILYMIYCKKGRVVLAHGYSDVIAATPHVKYKYTVGDWIATGFLGLLLLGLVVLFGSLAMSH